MIDVLIKLLEDEQDLSQYVEQLSCQIESLERENASRMERFDKVKSKIERLNSIRSLLVYIENPCSDEFRRSNAHDFLERMIRSGYR